jgi:hypothetical protein
LLNSKERSPVPKFHKDSIFGFGPRVPLDREHRAQFRAKLKLQRRPGRLTIAAAEVGRVLVDMLGADGRLDPSYETIATLACVCKDTAVEAVKQLRAFGFLDWTRRMIRGRETGGRVQQSSNAYVLRVPATDTEIPVGVPGSLSKRRKPEGAGGWEAQVAERDRQLAALGMTAEAARAGLEAVQQRRAGLIGGLFGRGAAPATPA